MAVDTMTEQTNWPSDPYKQRLHDALEEAYAPLRSGGPGLGTIFGMIVKELFHPEPPVPRDQPIETLRPESRGPAL